MSCHELHCSTLTLGTGKKTPGEPGHTRDTSPLDTRAHTGTRITQTNLTTIQTHQHTRTTSRRPNPRPARGPAQQPQPRCRTLPAADSEEAAPSEPDPAACPPPASRAPPRACSKAVGEMKARAADA